MERKGLLVVVSGFAGSGKGTLMKGLINKYDNYALSVSATTRNPRPGEEDGREYFFKTTEEFERMISDDAFVEYARYVNNYYGTPKEYVFEQLDNGKDVILEIEIQGALQVKEKFPETLLLFVTPPDAETLKNRLVGRGTEDAKTIGLRLARAASESEGIEKYDYILVNDELDECIESMHNIIQNEKYRTFRNIPFINRIREELKGFAKGE
ncbi:MAG: guanylate kinase [Lachnospiraceae bacterium]|nr:guanylate kinase [Lachnospiraceae bacterium]